MQLTSRRALDMIFQYNSVSIYKKLLCPKSCRGPVHGNFWGRYQENIYMSCDQVSSNQVSRYFYVLYNMHYLVVVDSYINVLRLV